MERSKWSPSARKKYLKRQILGGRCLRISCPRKHTSKSMKRHGLLVLREYCECTSIHGVKYLGQSPQRKLDIVWWCLFLSTAVGCSILVICNLWIKWRDEPVIVTFSQRSTPIWEIPFPAVTICPETKCSKNMFNFTDVHYRIRKNEPLTQQESHNYEAISQVCQTDQELSFGQNISDGARLVQTLKKLMPLGGNFAFSCQLGSDKKDCSQILHPMVTGVGMCLTFNAFDEEEMYRKENIHSLYPYHTHKKWASDRWSTENGYFYGFHADDFPVRFQSSGTRAALSLYLALPKRDIDYLCEGGVQGFRVHLHQPADAPHVY